MSHATGHCIGPGSRTGPHCVPIEQRPPVPAGRSFGQVPGSPSAPGLLSPSVPVGPGREGSPGAGRALLTPKNPAVARGHPQSWLQPLHPPTGGLAGAAAAPRGSKQGTEDPRSLHEQQTSPPTTFPLLSLARIGQAAGGERQLGTAGPWQEPAWPEGHSPQPDPGSRSSPLPPLRCTDKARPRAPRGGWAGTVPVGPGLQRGQKKQDRGRGWHRHKQTPSLHQTSCRTHPHHHHPPPGTQATAVTTISFYSLHFYIHGIKPSSSTRLQQPDRPQGCSHQLGGSAQPGGVPGTPPVGTGTGGPSTTGNVEGGWPQKCWDGSIHQTDGERTPTAAQGWRLSDCPKSPKTRELELPAVLEPSARCRAPSSRAKSFPAGNFPSVKKKKNNKTTKAGVKKVRYKSESNKNCTAGKKKYTYITRGATTSKPRLV